MQVFRPVFASHPMRFGRGPLRQLNEPAPAGKTVAGDIKLFAATFVAGFLFVAILIG
jgi:hypothetical protein